jgi:hypothetical protein
LEDGGMSREIAGLIPGSIKEAPRLPYRAGASLPPVSRLRQPPMIRMSCVTQHANIRLIIRRGQFPCSFRYHGFSLNMKNQSDFIRCSNI